MRISLFHNKKSLSLLKYAAFFILNIALFHRASAQSEIDNPVDSGTFGELITKIAAIITQVTLPLVILFLILAGAMFVFGRGNPQQLARAKTIFWWTVIGAAIIVGAWFIAIAIDNFGRALSE
ncbi:MAG: hypothetical protein COU47_02300 [Candidatus Niyogibacteria bacterium CG10_big_fil_rev_8_21_14_0_10_46_36]|uniref:Uncharacterized protein n=1 Tax=Candidatus Niyogibacteria bacterium CG10_big_fil_rev_8_21_14_0_10_46_36 TaxID=1974726 RepID=A0A2H0TDD8_9BACT|nr:MAG: hypothetical protein COU47_02300 [Candidatus Niyogibacteria bacterium CG10_big_fil_rev_8_21_14_0_10_46_36]